MSLRPVQELGALKRQFEEIFRNALDKRDVVTVVSDPVADVEYAVAHGLGFIPNGFLVVSQDKAGVTYKGTTAWTEENLYLQTNTPTVALTLLLF